MTDWRIAGYDADELIGFGGAGEVWRGRDARTDEPVALKRLRASDDSARARLRREATLLAALDHPHLIRVRECVCTDASDVLVLDFAPRGSLASLLAVRRLTPGEVVTVIAPIAAALAHAHNEGLVHGDVTAGNILFGADGRPLLSDLGVARVLTDRGTVHATPDYIDPVVARGASPGQASDVFSLAAVAFHALTGLPPWNAATVDDTVAVAASGQLPDLAELAPQAPEQLVRVLRRALSVEPSARGSAAELALDVRHACLPQPVSFSAAPPPAVARPTAQTHAVRTRPPVVPPGAKHRRSAVGRRGWVRRVVRSKGLRAGVLAVLAIAGAVRIGVAWADAGSPGAGSSDAGSPGAGSSGAGSSGAGSSGAGSSGAGSSDARSSDARSSDARSSDARSSDAAAEPTPTARHRSPPARPTEARTPDVSAQHTRTPAQRWSGALRALDARRQRAFAAAEAAGLDRVYTPDSAARDRDAATMRRLRAADVVLVGVRHRIHRVDVVEASATVVRLDAVQSLASYRVDRGGGADEEVAAAKPRHYRITLLHTDDGWRISTLSRR